MLATCVLAALVSIQIAADEPGAQSDQPAATAPSEAPKATEKPLPEGWVKPHLAEANCIADRVAQTTLAQGVEAPPRVVVKFKVTTKGVVTEFQTLTEVHKELAKILYEAIWTCRWLPGKDPQGASREMWVVLPIRLIDDDASAGAEAK